jgi:hypothetical protein
MNYSKNKISQIRNPPLQIDWIRAKLEQSENSGFTTDSKEEILKQSKELLKEDWWEQLSKSQQKMIKKGMEDIENGNVISSKQFWDKLKNV